MKKATKSIIGVCIVIVFVASGLLLYAGNYLYDLALNPATDKSLILDNSITKNATEVVKVKDDIFKSKSKDIYVDSKDGLKLHGYEINQESNTWVIVVHGYSSQGNQMSWAARRFYNQGYNVVVPDLRGHGRSEGDYIAMGWDDRLDILQWINEIVKKDPNSKIVLYGISMGASTIMNTVGEELPENVELAIEDCGYTNTWDIFSYQLNSVFDLPEHPFLDAANLVTNIRAGYNFNDGPINQIEKCKIPMLFIHGSKDTFVPSYMVEELYNKATCPKDKLIIPNAGHAQSNDFDPDTYWNKINTFIDAYLK